MKPILNIALRAARKAGSFLVYERIRLDAAGNPQALQELQVNTEVILRETISKTFPDHEIVSEAPDFNHTQADVVWYIEAINGQENFMRNIPHYAIIIVVYEQQKLQHALIYDPNCEEFFVASNGNGAKCDDYRIRMNNKSDLVGSLFMSSDDFIDSSIYSNLRKQNAKFHFQGCTTLALAYTAAGRADAFCGSGLTAIELAAGTLLLQETGALLGDFQGGHDYVAKQELLATNPKLFKASLQALKKVTD
jgi:myo-inositol-1(or 4)-monophosphatase